MIWKYIVSFLQLRLAGDSCQCFAAGTATVNGDSLRRALGD